MKLMFLEVRVPRLGPSRCVSSFIGTGERLFLLYGWATFFISSCTLFPSFFSGLSHRRYVTSAVVLDTTRAFCMHSSSHHPSQQQAHHSGLDVLHSFLSTGVLGIKPSLSFGDAQGYSYCHNFTLASDVRRYSPGLQRRLVRTSKQWKLFR